MPDAKRADATGPGGPRPERLRLVVGIATAGRRDVVGAVAPLLAEQSRPPDLLLVSPAGADDVDPAVLADLPFASTILRGARGLTRQRNLILDHAIARGGDVVAFLDDDFLLADDFLHEAERLFRDDATVAVATGHVIADGIGGPGLSLSDARRRLSSDRGTPDAPPTPAAPVAPVAPVAEVYNAYGCNMVVRLAPVRRHGLRFDEDLPFYGWLEDVDFSRRLAPHGRIVRSARLRGVHMGTKGGRSPGVRLGYSQIANPWHLASKGTMLARRAARMALRNIAANILKAARPEPWIDRRGRLKGNMLGLLDLARGRLAPGRVASLD